MIRRIRRRRTHPAMGMAERRLPEIAVERKILAVLREENRRRRQQRP